MFGLHRNFPAGSGSTADATAEQWHIKSGKTAYIASGKVTGNAYTPALMLFSGSSYFSDTLAKSGNKYTCVVRFARASFSGGGRQALINIRGGALNRLVVWINSNDYATAAKRDKITCYTQNTGGATVLDLTSLTSWADGNPHTLFLEYDGDAGTAVLRIDGVADINTGEADYTVASGQTLPTSSAADFIGCRSGPTDYFSGQLGFTGYRDVGGLSWSDFMQTDGSPKNIEATLSTVWGGSPLLWNPHCDARDNRGSSGAWAQTGTIVVGDGGAS